MKCHRICNGPLKCPSSKTFQSGNPLSISMDESDVDDTIHSLGFMFDAEHEKTYLDLTLRHLSLRIKTIGENPGHKQSGQYVWPASKAIGEYMIDNLESFKDVTNIIEFGSGCGIGGLTAAKLFSCGRVVLTDYDPGTLTLIEDSASLNGVEGKCSAQFLEWGNTSDPAVLLEPGSFDFAIGADLIYSKDVVAPLFKSVKYYLDSVAGRFLLVTSFALGEVTGFTVCVSASQTYCYLL